MSETVEVLTTDPTGQAVTSGFSIPFRMEKLCAAIGENLGGNNPDPSWFEGFDVLVASRLLTQETAQMPTAALLRRTSDGALRLIASDQIKIGYSYGADILVKPSQKSLVLDVFSDTSDDSKAADLVAEVSRILDNAEPFHIEGTIDILAERRVRNDLSDIRTNREINPIVDRLEDGLQLLACPDRRARALAALRSLRGELVVEEANSN